MKARLTIALLGLIVLCAPAFAQAQSTAQNVTAGEPTPSEIGKDQAQQLLKEVSVEKFEDAAFWYAAMPLDMGVATTKRMVGSPAAKQPIADEVSLGIKEDDKYVLGAKVSFFRRGASYFFVHPVNPIPVEGIVKTLSVWVVGRNYNHTLKVLFQDYRGQAQELTVGTLNFIGWKKLTVALPPSILQTGYHSSNRSGIRITGFEIDIDPLDAYGTYYVYFDDLRAVTDLFGESKRDTDDMSDDW
ncbi:MAG TPA: flagellar filament outer layer protein FlaA [Spirochaetia bacterium]